MKLLQICLIFVVYMLLIFGCASKYQIRRETKEQSDSMVLKNHLSKQTFDLKSKDSNHFSYELQVMPKGKFTYGDNGFVGEAYWIKVKGLKTQKREFTQKSQNAISAKERIEKQKVTLTKDKLINKKRLSWWPLFWVCVFVALVLTAMRFLFKRKLE